MKIVADNKIPFLEEGLKQFSGQIEYVLKEGKTINKNDLLDADALIVRTRTKCNETLLEGTKVRFVASATIGYDHIDTDYCNQKGIFWTNAPGCNSSSVMQYIASAILNIAHEKKLRLKNITIGIIGVGNVGSKVAKFANLLGMRVLLNDPPRARKEGSSKFVDIETILSEAQIITLHVPLSFTGPDKTFHLADKNFFSRIRNGALFINSSRGEVVDSTALKKAILEHKLGEVVLDVWENEPNIDIELLKLAKFATPHIAGYSTDGKANGTAMCINALNNFFQLGKKEWCPKSLPKPENDIIEIDCANKTLEDIFYESVKTSYDIKQDDCALRKCPENFEKLRGDYPVRREFPAYTLKLKHFSAEIAECLQSAGFNVF